MLKTKVPHKNKITFFGRVARGQLWMNTCFKIFLSYKKVNWEIMGCRFPAKWQWVFISSLPTWYSMRMYKKLITASRENKRCLSFMHIQKIEPLAFWIQCLDQIPGWSFQYWTFDNFSLVVKEKKGKNHTRLRRFNLWRKIKRLTEKEYILWVFQWNLCIWGEDG